MALNGGHSAGSSGHIGDHNLIDQALTTAAADAATIATGRLSEASQSAAFANKNQTQTFVVDVNGEGTHTTIAAALADAQTGARILLRQNPLSLVASHYPTDSIQLPNIDGVTLEGWGISVAGIEFPAGKGFFFNGARNNRDWQFKNLYVASSNQAAGMGFDLTNATSGVFENIRISGYLRGINGAGALDSHHWKFDNCRVTNCGIAYYVRGGVGGCNNWRIIGGEISSNGVGIDSDGGSWHIDHPSLESNTDTAIIWDGSFSDLDIGRLEGNAQDLVLGPNSYSNRVFAPTLNPSKFTDSSTFKSNTVNHGVVVLGAPVIREPLQTVDPRVARDKLLVPAANVGMFSKIYPTRVMKVTSIAFIPSISAGNVDVGIWGSYDPSVPISTSGSAAVAIAGGVQVVTLSTPVTLTPGIAYDVGIAFSDGSVKVVGIDGLSNWDQGQANLLDRTSYYKGSMFPLAGKNLSGVSDFNSTPWLRLA